MRSKGSTEDYIVRSVLNKYYLDDKIKKHEMGGTCTKYGGKVRCIQSFGGETGGNETTWKT